MKHSLLILTLLLSLFALAEDACVLTNKEISRSQQTNKFNQETLAAFQANIQEMNNYTNGSVMKTVRWGIETTFLFSDRETKNMVKNFFGNRLLVNQNYQLATSLPQITELNSNLSVDQNLTIIKFSEIRAVDIIETLAATQSNERAQAVQSEINALLQEKDNDNIRSFGDIAISVANQEVQLAKYKAIAQISQSKLQKLQTLQKMKCQ